MHPAKLDLVVAAAEHVVPAERARQPKSYATWRTTRQDDDFDADASIRYLRAEGEDCDESLLHQYGRLHAHHDAMDLGEITRLAPWIDCLDESFVEYASFEKLRQPPRYIEILTFTTPAISETGDAGFLEVWTEHGRHSHMGTWWWLQLRRKDAKWSVDWLNIHAIS